MAKEFSVDVECTEGGISGEVGAPHGDGGCVDVGRFVGALRSVDVVGCCREVLVCCRKVTTCCLEIVGGWSVCCHGDVSISLVKQGRVLNGMCCIVSSWHESRAFRVDECCFQDGALRL